MNMVNEWKKSEVDVGGKNERVVWEKPLPSKLALVVVEPVTGAPYCKVIEPDDNGPDVILTGKSYPPHTSHEELCKEAEKLYNEWRKNIAKVVLNEVAKFENPDPDAEPVTTSEWKTESVTENAVTCGLRIGDTHLLRVVVYHRPDAPQEGSVTVSILKLREGGYNSDIAVWRALGDYNEEEAKTIAAAIAVRWVADKCLANMDCLRDIVCGGASQFIGSVFFTPRDIHLATQKKIKEALELAEDVGNAYVEQ